MEVRERCVCVGEYYLRLLFLRKGHGFKPKWQIGGSGPNKVH